MSKLKEFFENLKRKRVVEEGVKTEERIVQPGYKRELPELVVLDNSGYEFEKQQAIAELEEIKNGGEISVDDLQVLLTSVKLPQKPAMLGGRQVSFESLLSGQFDLLNNSLMEVVVVKKYGPHHAVALRFNSGKITDNVHYETYNPQDEETFSLVIDGERVVPDFDMYDYCKDRWGKEYLINSRRSVFENDLYKRTVLTGYDKQAEDFANYGDYRAGVTLGSVISCVASRASDYGASKLETLTAIDECLDQLIKDIELYAVRRAEMVARLKKAAQSQKDLIVGPNDQPDRIK